MNAAAIATELRIERIQDERLIASAIRHPRIYPHVSDDGCPSAAQFKVALSDALLYLGVFEDEDFLGVFLVQPHNAVLFEIHTALLPSAWGPRAVAAGHAVLRWLWDNTACRRCITSVPRGNLLALRLATNVGMAEYAVNPRSILRGGELIDQHLLGINKDETCQ